MNRSTNEPIFDPTNPKKPVFLDNKGAPIPQQTVYYGVPVSDPKTSRNTLKTVFVTRLLIFVMFVGIGGFSTYHDSRNNETTPPSTSSGQSTLTVSNSPSDTSIPFEDPSQAVSPSKTITTQPQGDLTLADTERKKDLKDLYDQLNGYYFNHGYFPTFSAINNPNWRMQNLKNLSEDTLRDPNSNTSVLTAAGTPNTYSYSAISTTRGICNNVDQTCQAYRLTAILSNGMPYYQDSL